MQIGIDLGATKIESVLLDDNGTELHRSRKESPKDYKETINSIAISVNQIEKSMRSDAVWDRPSWPLKGNFKNAYDEFYDYTDDFTKTNDDKINENYYKNKLIDETLTYDESQAIKRLELKLLIQQLIFLMMQK